MTSICCNTCQAVTVVENNDQRVTYCKPCNSFIDLNDLGAYTFKTIGEFEIIKKIGSGAMGNVYEALQKSLDRKVALKVLPPTPSSDHQIHVKRFLHEMKLAAQIQHPYIVSVHQAGEAQGFPYYSMNLIHGDNLENMVRKNGPLEEVEALKIALNVAEALESIWSEFQIIHRDIKPSNIMLNHKSIVQVLDMGLARGMNDQAQFTRTGVVLGSPLFLSPEQASQDQIDFRSDIFSLGTTLYFLLTGHVPFTGKSIPEILHNVINKPFTPLDHYSKEISTETAILIDMMLSKNKNDRFESWKDIIETIHYILTDSSYTGIALFNTSQLKTSEKESYQNKLNKPNDFCETATAILKSDCDLSTGKFPVVEFTHIGSGNPTHDALIRFTANQFEKIQGLTGVMDWVPMEKCPEIKKTITEFRDSLNEAVNVIQDFNFVSSHKLKKVKHSKDVISVKYFSHRLKAEARKACSDRNLEIHFDTNLSYDDDIKTDVALFMRMIVSCMKYLTAGMDKGELIIKMVHNEGTDIEIVRFPYSCEPTFNPQQYKSHSESIEGAYFFLASQLAPILGGKLTISAQSTDKIRFSFDSLTV